MTALLVDLVSEHASPLAAIGDADAGGQNVHVAALATTLADLGCHVTVLTRADDHRLPARVSMAPGVDVVHVTAGPRSPLPKDELWAHMPEFARQLRRRWQVATPDVVHAHFWMSGWAAVRAATPLVSAPPVVQTFHALGVVKRRHQGAADTSPTVRCQVERDLVGAVDHIVATCRDEVAELAALGGETERISVVPCGIDPDMFRPDGPRAPRSGGARRIVVASRLVRRKGIEDVIAALPDLPGTELLVAGGPPADALAADTEARHLRRFARRMGVGDRVRLLGAVAREDMPALLRSADLVACVPWYEPFGIVPLEAMACGVPVVGTAVGGLLDTVVDRRTGILVPPRDPRAFAGAAARLLSDPAQRERMGAAAAARVRERYAWSRVGRSTLDVYERLLAGDRPASLLPVDHDWAVPA